VTRDPLMELADRHLIRYVPGFAPFLVERARGSWVWLTIMDESLGAVVAGAV